MDCFGTFFTHAQCCDSVRVHGATEWTASVHTLHRPKAVITFVFKVLQKGLLRYTYSTHVQNCDIVHVHSATEWTASVHTLHMPKAVITFMSNVLQNVAEWLCDTLSYLVLHGYEDLFSVHCCSYDAFLH